MVQNYNTPMITYGSVIFLSWAAFIVVWGVGALRVKRDIKGGDGSLRYRYWLLRLAPVVVIALVSFRIAGGRTHHASRYSIIFRSTLFAPPVLLGWFGASLCALGVLFAIWARVHLGRNWSPSPAIKDGHDLVTRGPYRWVRHPIYAGVILAAFGASLAGRFFGIGIFLVVSLLFFSRIDKEERIMLELFPDKYPAYQMRTKKLIPFVW